MCGHVGVAGALEFKDEALMKRLLMYDYFRGMDSTGLAAVRHTNESFVAKIASHPIDLFDSDRFKKALAGATSKVFMGHNRAATKGVVNGVNAHPFEFDHIIGAHNGTLEDSSWNKLAEVTGEKFGVDSMNVIHAIAKLGIEETMKHMNGAWSLVWVNKADNTLNFLRNDKRPMWLAYQEDFKKMMWASEWPMIRAALDLSAQEYKMYKTDEGFRFFETAVDVWYRFDLDKLKAGGTSRPKARVKELKGEGPAAAKIVHTYNPFGRNTSNTTTSTTPSTTTKSHSNNVVNLFGNKTDPFSGYVSPEEFQELTKHGCAFCHDKIEGDEPGLMYIEEADKIICPACTGNNTFNTVLVKDLNKVVNR